LETSLEESTRTISSLNLAIDMHKTEVIQEHENQLLLVKKDLTDQVKEVNLWVQKATRLQSKVDELEGDIDESVELIQKFGASLRKN
jgi:peptidoglycan hydrolase CwlO-like protein